MLSIYFIEYQDIFTTSIFIYFVMKNREIQLNSHDGIQSTLIYIIASLDDLSSYYTLSDNGHSGNPNLVSFRIPWTVNALKSIYLSFSKKYPTEISSWVVFGSWNVVVCHPFLISSCLLSDDSDYSSTLPTKIHRFFYYCGICEPFLQIIFLLESGYLRCSPI